MRRGGSGGSGASGGSDGFAAGPGGALPSRDADEGSNVAAAAWLPLSAARVRNERKRAGHFALGIAARFANRGGMSASADYTFASDNTAGMAPEALNGLLAANAGTVPSYGADPWTPRARQLIRELFETDCEVFFVFNGTAANSLALAHYCRPYHSILCHALAHVETDECSAPEFFVGGAKVVPLEGPNAKLRPEDIAPVFTRGRGVHSPKPGALSLTQCTELGTVYTPAEIRALADLAHRHGCAVHMDGARFANAAAALAARGFKPADFTWRAGVDVLSSGGTKNGMNTTEAVVFFHPDSARDFDYRVKQGAQLASKQRFASAQWCGMLENGAWRRHAAHANAMAQRLAAGLDGLPGVRLAWPAEANGVFVELTPEVFAALEARGWHFYRFVGDHVYRLMTSWETTPERIDRFLAELRAVLTVR
jgi:threonine aldolase